MTTTETEERVAAYFHCFPKRCSICGEFFTDGQEIWETEAKELYSQVKNAFRNGKVIVKAHTDCWQLKETSH